MPSVVFGELQTINMFMHEGVNGFFESSDLEERQLPFESVTGNKSYRIQVFWEPTEIKPNQIVSFDIKFVNYVTNRLVNNVHYDFLVTKDDQIIKELRSSFAVNGMATHTVEFPSSGSFSLMVNVLGVGEFSAPQNESITFELKVVPEFPLSTVVVMASVVGIMVALTRLTVMNKKQKL
jgi:hypothetical protein